MSQFEIFWNSLFQPIHIGNQVFAFSIAMVVTEFLLPVGLYLASALVGFRWLNNRLKKLGRQDNRQIRIFQIIRLSLWLVGALLVLGLGSRFTEVRVGKFFEDVFLILTRPIYHSGNTVISIMTMILAVPVLYISILAGKTAKVAFERSRLIASSVADGRRSTIANLLRYCVLILTMALGLSIIGLDLSSIGLFFGVVGVSLGIGLQHMVANFFSGLLLIIDRPVKEFDYIQVFTNNQNYRGQVKQVRMLSTLIKTSHQGVIMVPNLHFTNNAVHNFTINESSARLALIVSLAPTPGFNKAEAALLALIKTCPFAPPDENDLDHAILIESVSAESIVVAVSFTVVSADHVDQARDWFNRELLRLSEQKINLKLA